MIPVIAVIQEEQTIACLDREVRYIIHKKSFKYISSYVLELSKTLFHTPTSVLVGVIVQFKFWMRAVYDMYDTSICE